MPSLDIQIDEKPNAVVVRLTGHAAIGESNNLQSSLNYLEEQHPPLVVFDLARLDYVTSLTMGMLIAFRRGLARHDGKVKLAAARPMVLETFRVAGLSAVFDFVDSVEGALSPVNSPAES
jgi:anti-anti-sigma factor